MQEHRTVEPKTGRVGNHMATSGELPVAAVKHLARLAVAIEADVAAQRATMSMPTTSEPAATLATVS